MKCQTITHPDGKKYFMPYCWGGVIHGPRFCTCYPPKKKKNKKVTVSKMDIINLLHSAFREAQYFEFGDDFVRFYDHEKDKHYEIKISEVEQEVKIKKQTVAVQDSATIIKKTIKGKAKTWESFIKAKNQSK